MNALYSSMPEQWREGYKTACFMGSINDCPFAEGTADFNDWTKGFNDAMNEVDDDEAPGGGPL